MKVNWYSACNGVVFEIKTKTKKALKENQTLRNLYLGKLGTMLKCLGAKLQGPKLNFIFRWIRKSAVCIFDTHSMNFLFLCMPVSTDSSNVQEFKNKSVGLHMPGNIPFTFTKYMSPLHSQKVPFGIWERTTLHCPDQDIFLRTKMCKSP